MPTYDHEIGLLRKDAARLEWAETHPLEFLRLVLGECPDDTDGLRVTSPITDDVLPSGALRLGPARWEMRRAIDEARAASAAVARAPGCNAVSDSEFRRGARAMFDHFACRAANHRHDDPETNAQCERETDLVMCWASDALDEVDPESHTRWRAISAAYAQGYAAGIAAPALKPGSSPE